MTAPAPPSTRRDLAPLTGALRLRLVVVPTPQPPLADDALPLRLVVPGAAVPRPAHRPGPRPRHDHPIRPEKDFGPEYCGRADLPDPRAGGRRLLTLVLEAFAGRRPIGQLRPLASQGLFAAVSAGRRPRWCAEGTAPFAVGPVHLCEPVDGVAEVSAVVSRAGRAHAVAARLEGIDGRWLCTALQIG
jgi:hypothetical protein